MEKKLCKCGCYEEVTPGNNYVQYHFWRGKSHTPSSKRKQRIAKLGKTASEETRELMSLSHLGSENQYTLGMVLTDSEETRSRKRTAALEHWDNPEYRTKVVKAQAVGARKKGSVSVTKPEQVLLDIIKDFELPFKLNRGDLVIDRYVPDFIPTNGNRVLIEVYGNYWHNQNRYPGHKDSYREKTYKELDYRLIVFWESELYNLSDLTVAMLIIDFCHNNENTELAVVEKQWASVETLHSIPTPVG